MLYFKVCCIVYLIVLLIVHLFYEMLPQSVGGFYMSSAVLLKRLQAKVVIFCVQNQHGSFLRLHTLSGLT